ncbi:cytochrome P450 [Nocardia sp. NPDC050406]|uniref:cytochrome P450 n=1 Tax=Nocardia sp. NPDC050406 TaxID=3364318 RepID=UPI0037BCCFB1
MTTPATDARAPRGPELIARIMDPAVRADPYPVLARIRELGVARLGPSTVVVSSYADCAALLRDSEASVERRNAAIPMGEMPIHDVVGERAGELAGVAHFLFRDPPDHTRLRRLVSAAFSPAVVRRLGPRIQTIVDDAFDRATAAGSLDIVADLAYPLPITVICELLGVPLDDEPRLREWSALVSRTLDPTSSSTAAYRPDAGKLVRANNELHDYFDRLAHTRRATPGPDLLSALIAVEDSGDTLTHEELIATCGLLLLAGHETTVNLIANAVLALLRHPRHLDTLRADPGFVSKIVEETLRYDPPVQLVPRIAREAITLGDDQIARGDLVIALLAAANRDPAAFPDPDVFDPDRDTRHLAFGLGPHFCLGAPLARQEAQLALTRFAQRVTDARLSVDPPPYREHVNLRGPARLPLAYKVIGPRTVPW